MKRGACSAAVDALMEEEFFQKPAGRTVSRIASWIADTLDSRARSTATPRKLLHAALRGLPSSAGCGHPPSGWCTTCVRTLAADLLRSSGVSLVQMGPADELPPASAVVDAINPQTLLTDRVLQDVADHVPSPDVVWPDPDGIRAELEADGRFDETLLGVEEIQPFLAHGDLPCEWLDAANRLLVHIDTTHKALRHALASETPPSERAAFARFHEQAEAPKDLGLPVYLPTRRQATRAVCAYVDSQADATATMRRLAAVLDPPAAVRRLRGPWTQVRQVVWDELVMTSDLPSADIRDHIKTGRDELRGVNRSRLVRLLGGTFPNKRVLAGYPDLHSVMEREIGRGRPRGSRTSDDPIVAEMTLAQVRQVLLDWHDRHGRLPHATELDQDVLASAEATLGFPLSTFVDRLVIQHGLTRPGRTAPEMAGEALVRDAFADRIVSLEAEWSQFDGAAWRVDNVAELTWYTGDPLVLYCEWDGPSHFREVPGYQQTLAAKRHNDREKSRELHGRAEAGEPLLQVNVHHLALTRQRTRLDPEGLRRIVARALQVDGWWVYVRPTDARTDNRAYIGTRPRKLEVDGLDGLEVLVSTR